eukprot:COSAG02_NODE_3962_length_5981_cov_104.850731_2_plen_67_part_00
MERQKAEGLRDQGTAQFGWEPQAHLEGAISAALLRQPSAIPASAPATPSLRHTRAFLRPCPHNDAA